MCVAGLFFYQKERRERMGSYAFIKLLGRYRDVLSRQQLRTFKGQALSGNAAAALKGLERVLKRHGTRIPEGYAKG